MARSAQACQGDLERLEEEIEYAKREEEVLHGSLFHQPDEASQLYWTMRNWPALIFQAEQDARTMLARAHTRYLDELKANQAKLLEDIQMLQAEVEQFVEASPVEAVSLIPAARVVWRCRIPLLNVVLFAAQLGGMESVDERIASVQDVEDRLKRAEELAELYNRREEIFGLSRTEYTQTEAIRKTFEPYANVWKVRRNDPHRLQELTRRAVRSFACRVRQSRCAASGQFLFRSGWTGHSQRSTQRSSQQTATNGQGPRQR